MNYINRRELFHFSGSAALGLTLGNTIPGLLDAAEAPSSSNPVSLSGNENPYGPSPGARAALGEQLDFANRYAYSAQLAFVKEIAHKEGVTPDHIVLGAGSSEVLCATGAAYCGGDGHTIAADLGFGMVAGYADTVGGEVDYVPLDDEMRHDLNAMHARINNKTGMIYIVNPNNPTGTLVDAEALRDFCRSVPGERVVLVDEAYLEFTDRFAELTMLDEVRNGGNVVVARTFSKIHGLAGLRIGYVVARPDIADRITRFKMCKFQGPFAVAAARASLNDVEFQQFCRQKVREGRKLVHDLCEQHELDYTDSAGNFVFIDPKMSNAEFKQRMLAHGFEAARPFPPRPDWARITLGTTEEMAAFKAAFASIIAA